MASEPSDPPVRSAVIAVYRCRHGGCSFTDKDEYVVRQHEEAMRHTPGASDVKKRCSGILRAPEEGGIVPGYAYDECQKWYLDCEWGTWQ